MSVVRNQPTLSSTKLDARPTESQEGEVYGKAEETIREAGSAANRDLGAGADPDRDRPLDRVRQDAGMVDRVPGSVIGKDILGP